MTGKFSNDCLRVRTKDGQNFVLLESFSFTRPSGEVITVPAGTTSDGASTPRSIWSLIPPFGLYFMAAFLHDWSYRDSDLPKETCDTLLLEGMEALAVEIVERETIYEGVKRFGQHSFDEDRKQRTKSQVPVTTP